MYSCKGTIIHYKQKALYVLNNISTREDKQEWGHWSSSLPQCKFSVFHCIVCRRMNIERSWLVCMRCGRRIFILFVCKSVNFQYSLYVEYSGAQSGKEDIQRRFYFIHYRKWLRFKANIEGEESFAEISSYLHYI